MDNNKENTLDIEKAKELFEYEMTDVLRSFKREAEGLLAGPAAEIAEMEMPSATIEYSSPELELAVPVIEQAAEKPAFEALAIKTEKPEISVGEIGVYDKTVGIAAKDFAVKLDTALFGEIGSVGNAPSFGEAVFSPKVVSSVEIAPQAVAAVKAASFAGLADKLAEAGKRETKLGITIGAIGLPKTIGNVLTHSDADKIRISHVPSSGNTGTALGGASDRIKAVSVEKKTVEVPGSDSVRIGLEYGRSASSGIDKARFGTAAAALPEISGDVLSGAAGRKNGIEINVEIKGLDMKPSDFGVGSVRLSELVFPEVPAKPELSAAFEEILDSVKSEL